ncbi:beta-1,3-galactosyltransferase 1 [Plakobranchus ocellatus]|uniref:Beta-1,3-galactosyltransferase 1 n=1 Tax=Plakobranchus ocellatus TaxID=259542 RepID=A0AAV4DUT3_9GAST|nr:beta-1,3-galactosyltransferase 1 [Plakobranchus ocellatus]
MRKGRRLLKTNKRSTMMNIEGGSYDPTVTIEGAYLQLYPPRVGHGGSASGDQLSPGQLTHTFKGKPSSRRRSDSMSKKNQSRCSTLSDCCRGCFDCQCRRRTCTNKILPAIIQIFIVIAVWTILKAQMMPDESTMLAEAQAEAAERYARSAQQFERDHNCSMGDYMRGSVLHVDGMLSQAHILAPESNQKRPHFLSVDVLIRDVEEGTMVLYPVGTPVNFGSIKIYYPEEEQAAQELLREGALGTNDTKNGTEIQFENPDDVAARLDVDSIEGHLVPEHSLSQPGPLGQGPLGSVLFPPGQQPILKPLDFQPFGQEPSLWQKPPAFPNPGYVGNPASLYPNPAQPAAVAPLPLSLGEMGIPPFVNQRNQMPFGPSFPTGLNSQQPFGAPQSAGAPGIGQAQAPGDENLVLTRKPDGGYSLRFKKQSDETGRQGQGVNNLGPGPQNIHGGAEDLHLGGQAWQYGPPRRFGANQPAGQLPAEQTGGEGRFPFGQQSNSPLGQSRLEEQSTLSQSKIEEGSPNQPAQPPQTVQLGQSEQPNQNEQPNPSGQSSVVGESSTQQLGTSEDQTKPSNSDSNTDSPNPIPAPSTDDSATPAPTSDENKPSEAEGTPGSTVQVDGEKKEESSDTAQQAGEANGAGESSKESPQGSSDDKKLFADGFEDRLKKFKIELFGKETDDKGDDGSLTGNFRMNNPEICAKLDTVDILYLVASKPQSMDVRDRIRQGYVNPAVLENIKMAHIFLVGLTNSENFRKNLDTEKESYNDVAMGEYVDAPENATLKALSGFRWAKQFCKQAKHVLYVDESFFVDTDKLVNGLIPTANKVAEEKHMLCPFMPSFPIPRQGPNAVKKPLFPTSTNFRPYCKSYAVLLSQSAMLSLLAASEQVPMFPAPEIYLFGVLPYIVGDIEVYDVGSKRAFHDFGQEVIACYEEKKDRCPMLASKASSARFETLFNMMKTRMQSTHIGWEGDNTGYPTTYELHVLPYRRVKSLRVATLLIQLPQTADMCPSPSHASTVFPAATVSSDLQPKATDNESDTRSASLQSNIPVRSRSSASATCVKS